MKMNEKNRNTAGAQKLTDKQLEAVNGGMKIMLVKQPKLIDFFLRLLFRIKRKQ